MREIRQEARVVVISDAGDTDVIARAIEAGGSGYVPKTHAAKELVTVIRRVAAGEIVIPVEELMQTLSRLQKLRSDHSEVGRLMEQLTGREVEVVTLMSEGLSTEDISRRLQIRPATTRAHIRSVLAKLMVHSRLQAVGLALREGFIPTRNR
jgi:two-component system, NarL family, response regulator DevR